MGFDSVMKADISNMMLTDGIYYVQRGRGEARSDVCASYLVELLGEYLAFSCLCVSLQAR